MEYNTDIVLYDTRSGRGCVRLRLHGADAAQLTVFSYEGDERARILVSLAEVKNAVDTLSFIAERKQP